MTRSFEDGAKGASTLDTSGTWCPEPIMLLSEHIERCQSGDRLHLISTDPAALRDVPKYCQAMGHQLLGQQVTDATWEFVIQVR